MFADGHAAQREQPDAPSTIARFVVPVVIALCGHDVRASSGRAERRNAVACVGWPAGLYDGGFNHALSLAVRRSPGPCAYAVPAAICGPSCAARFDVASDEDQPACRNSGGCPAGDANEPAYERLGQRLGDDARDATEQAANQSCDRAVGRDRAGREAEDRLAAGDGLAASDRLAAWRRSSTST